MLTQSVIRRDRTRAQAAATAAGVAGAAVAIGLIGPDLPGGLNACPTHVLLGIDCPACGATRGVHALVTGDLGAALSHNLLLAVVVPLATVWWLGQVRQATGGPALHLPRLSRSAWTAVFLLVAAFAVARNLALPGLAWLDAA